MSTMRDGFGMYSGIEISVQEVRFFNMAELNLFDLPKLPLWPVAGRGLEHGSYTSAVLMWANEYGPMSDGEGSNAFEYGAMIYRASSSTRSIYFMGETYKGFQPNDDWYTVVNGLIVGAATFGVRKVLDLFPSRSITSVSIGAGSDTVTVSIIGFAHTHPVGRLSSNRSAPSGPDRAMRFGGNLFGVDIFPIIWFESADKGSDREINYSWTEEYRGH